MRETWTIRTDKTRIPPGYREEQRRISGETAARKTIPAVHTQTITAMEAIRITGFPVPAPRQVRKMERRVHPQAEMQKMIFGTPANGGMAFNPAERIPSGARRSGGIIPAALPIGSLTPPAHQIRRMNTARRYRPKTHRLWETGRQLFPKKLPVPTPASPMYMPA